MRHIRVFLLTTGLAVEETAGGIERFAMELARHLNRKQFRVTLCGLWRFDVASEHKWRRSLEEAGVATLRLVERGGSMSSRKASISGLKKALIPLREVLKTNKPDILHSHGEGPDVAAALVGRMTGVRTLIRTVHSEREWWRWPLLRAVLLNGLFPLTFSVEVGVSKAVVANLASRPVSRLLRKRPALIPNAIDLSRFSRPFDREAKRKELGLPTGVPVVGIIGRLTTEKGHVYFLEAAKHLLEIMPEVHFLIIGAGPLEKRLRGKVSQFDLSTHIHFLGARDDVEKLLSVLDLLVSSSLWEGLSTVILEGMAAGVPVVATDVSGSRELVEDGLTGRLVTPGNSQTLTRAIREVLGDKTQAQSFVREAQGRLARYSIGNVVKEYEELYRVAASTRFA